MARTQRPPEEKKETHKKRSPQKRKSETGVWPCEIDGCNKQFAREADLKRHQRTTKLHSQPGFACPQCDARFTRTDALRRHQKSRHNGVIIEPADIDKKKTSSEDDYEMESSESQSRSRSISPISKQQHSTHRPNPSTVPPTGGPSVPTSYYRQHTMNGAHPPPPGMMVDPQYAHSIGLPTSATRLHQANWPPPAPWTGDGSQLPLGVTAYHNGPGTNPGYYQPSPYYRGGTFPAHHPPHLSHPHEGVTPGPSSTRPSSRAGSPASHNVDSKLDNSCSSSSRNDRSADALDTKRSPDSTSPVIDPSLDVSAPNLNETLVANGKSVSLKITQAAMEAVLKSVNRGSEVTGDNESGEASDNGSPQNGSVHAKEKDSQTEVDVDGDEEAIAQKLISVTNSAVGDKRGSFNSSPTDSSSLELPQPMDQILTEDGEPMLNPAELLTQESLASPPPS